MDLTRTRLPVVTGAVTLLAAISVVPAFAASKHGPTHRATAASAAISRVTVTGSTIAVRGRVQLPRATAAERRRARVLVALSAPHGLVERHSVKISSTRSYAVTWTTKLVGRLTLSVRVTIAGKSSGRTATRTITVSGATTTPPAGGTPLVGIFKLTAGSAPSGQAPTGSYFEMLQSNGSPLPNFSSPGANKDYTPLTPGTDGGLSTEAYQPAPNPAFSDGSSGGALADKVIEPVPFYLINFSIETAATDAQLGTSDPVPSIDDDAGRLNGQLTAWVAQWNGQSFNQGTPKPNGTVPPPTTPLTGTYNSTTRAFTLEWKSLIVGGPFNGFTGSWHLAGTFAPVSSSSSGGLPLPVPPL
jgi:hypothetical protein